MRLWRQCEGQTAPNQKKEDAKYSSRGVTWYVQYSHTPYSFQVMCYQETRN